MRKVEINEIQKHTGSTLAQEVKFKGFTLVNSGEVLTEDLAKRLQGIGPELSFIYLSDIVVPKERYSIDDATINDLYQKVQAVMRSYSFDGVEDVNQVSEIMESIITSLFKNNLYLDVDISSILLNEPDISGHSLNTAIIAALLAIKSQRFQRWLVEQITLGALLHDIGLVPICEEEGCTPFDLPWEKLIEHPGRGYAMLENNQFIADSVKKIVLMHHFWEKPELSMDAKSGNWQSYPNAYKGRTIPKEAKSLSVSIVQSAVAFEHMTNSYDRISKRKAIQYLLSHANTIYGEGAVLLSNYISPYAIGEEVKLNSGKTAIVVKHTASPLRPIVAYSENSEPFDLQKKPHIKIVDD